MDGQARARWALPAMLPVLALVLILMSSALVLGGAMPAQAAATTSTDPLEVTLTSVTPSVVPDSDTSRAPVRVAGRVRNTTSETWQDINVYAFASAEPITTDEALTEAVSQPADAYVGDRLDVYVPIGDLGPGDTATFQLTVPRASLSTSPGVYWLGAQALGTDGDGRDTEADGRSRTLVSVVPPGAPRVPVSVVLPLRERVDRDARLALGDRDHWVSELAETGRLQRLLALAESGGSLPATLLVDPAVVDAIGSLTTTNGRDPGITPVRGDPRQEPSPSAGSSDEPSADASVGSDEGTSGTGITTNDDDSDTIRAQAWLTRLREFSGRHQVLGLGYGDPDLSALARTADGLVAASSTQSDEVLARYGIASRPAAAPARGDLSRKALTALAAQTTVLLGPDAIAPASGTDTGATKDTYLRAPGGQELTRTDPGLEQTPVNAASDKQDESPSDGSSNGTSTSPSSTPTGAGSSARTSAGSDTAAATGTNSDTGAAPPALYQRQQILAEAAIRALETTAGSSPEPVVVSLPDDWDPGPDWLESRFFQGLNRPSWLGLGALGAGNTGGAPTTQLDDLSRLDYPKTATRREIPRRQVAAAQGVVGSGRVYASALAEPDGYAGGYTRLGLLAGSEHLRGDADAYLGAVRLDQAVRDRLAGVQVVVGKPFVTMSGGSGRFVVTMVNQLKQPVRVGLRATSSSPDLRMTPETTVTTLAAGQRSTIRLRAKASGTGVRSVQISPVTAAGDEVGTPVRLTIRTSQVSSLVWGVMAAAFAVLVITIVRRAVRRGLRRRPSAPEPD